MLSVLYVCVKDLKTPVGPNDVLKSVNSDEKRFFPKYDDLIESISTAQKVRILRRTYISKCIM